MVAKVVMTLIATVISGFEKRRPARATIPKTTNNPLAMSGRDRTGVSVSATGTCRCPKTFATHSATGLSIHKNEIHVNKAIAPRLTAQALNVLDISYTIPARERFGHHEFVRGSFQPTIGRRTSNQNRRRPAEIGEDVSIFTSFEPAFPTEFRRRGGPEQP